MTGATIHMQEAEALFCAYRFALRGQCLIQRHRTVCCQHFQLHADAVANSNIFGLLANTLQYALNAGFINATHINPQRNCSRHNVNRTGLYVNHANGTDTAVGFFCFRSLVHRQNKLSSTDERVTAHPHRRCAAVVCHAFNMNLKACRCRNILHDTKLVLCLLQHLALLYVQLRKAFIAAGSNYGITISVRIAAPFTQGLDKADIALLSAFVQLLRRCAACQQFAAHSRKAKAARLLRTEDNHLNTALKLLVLQHVQRLQGTNHTAHAVIGTAMDYSVQMRTTSHRRQLRLFAIATQEHITHSIGADLQMQILHLLQQPALSFFIQRTVGKTGNALFTVRKSSQTL